MNWKRRACLLSWMYGKIDNVFRIGKVIIFDCLLLFQRKSDLLGYRKYAML